MASASASAPTSAPAASIEDTTTTSSTTTPTCTDFAQSVTEQFMTNWRSDVFRERCAVQIEDAREENKPSYYSNDPVEQFLADKTSKELEEFVFNKSHTREDYVTLVAEMVMMLRQHGGKSAVNTDVLEQASPEELASAGVTADGIDSLKEDNK